LAKVEKLQKQNVEVLMSKLVEHHTHRRAIDK
jgi:hypothetical protein